MNKKASRKYRLICTSVLSRAIVVLLILFLFLLVACGTGVGGQGEPDFKKQWALGNQDDAGIGAVLMWEEYESYVDLDEVIVALLDTEVDITHDDIEEAIYTNIAEIPNDGIDNDGNGYIDDIHGWDFVNNDAYSTYIENDSHGTEMAGVIVARYNKTGMAGVAGYENIKLLPLKVIPSDNEIQLGIDESQAIVSAIQYAEDMGARVCNLSFGYKDFDQDIYNVMDESNMLFVVSAGDSNFPVSINLDKVPQYPATYDLDNIITVTSILKDGTFDKNANHGQVSVDIFAPGSDVYTTIPGNKYTYTSGTSIATVHVTGVAALMFSVNPDWDAAQVKKLLISNVTKKRNLEGLVNSDGILDGKAILRNKHNE
jgi:subtilisin family serine protease